MLLNMYRSQGRSFSDRLRTVKVLIRLGFASEFGETKVVKINQKGISWAKKYLNENPAAANRLMSSNLL
jgi:hypothetical protein